MTRMGDKGTNHLALNEVAHGLQAFYLDQNSKRSCKARRMNLKVIPTHCRWFKQAQFGGVF